MFGIVMLIGVFHEAKRENLYYILLIKNERIDVVIYIKAKIGKLLKLLKEEIIVYRIG